MKRSSLPVSLAVVAGLTTVAQSDGYKQDALCVDGSNALCSTLPVDMPDLAVNAGYTPNTDAVPSSSANPAAQQQNFDYFAWQMFVALNWPATGSGTITTDVTSPRVWEGYNTLGQVYPQGAPKTSCAPGNGRLVVGQISKVTTSSFIEPFTPYPLIDQAGNFVVYDIRLNDIEAKYIRDNGLDTKAGQKAFGKAWNFPPGVGTTPGPIEIKTAWRVFPEGASTDGFFVVPGVVDIPAENSASGEALCLNVNLGLVGMHIMQKITNPSNFSDFWVWGTFEHVANAPVAEGATVAQMNQDSTATGNDPVSSCPVPSSAKGKAWSFFNSDCTSGGAACSPNAPPAEPNNGKYLWQSKAPFAKDYLHDGKFGTQATRCWDIYDVADTVTGEFRTAFGDSVWKNYQLVGTQWAQAAVVEYPDPLKPFPAPVYLTNTTLETYLQIDPVIDPKTGKPNQNASGSCITCHDIATDAAGNKSDFSFLSGYAK